MELPLNELKDGYRFQQLIAEYFRSLDGEDNLAGIDVQDNGTGPDGGVDLLVTFHYIDTINKHTRKWIIECKCWNEKRSVTFSDLDTDNILSLIKQHEADGYLLVCKGNVSDKIKKRFCALSAAEKGKVGFEIWEGARLWHKISERESLLKAYFPDFYKRTYSKEKEKYDAYVLEFQKQVQSKDQK